jgi:hypothetical protein
MKRNKQVVRRRLSRLARRRMLGLESLEERRLLATIRWDGGANTLNWTDAANWSGDALPGASDDVVIPDLGTSGVVDQTISISSASYSVRSITTAERVHITGGTLTVGASTVDTAVLAGTGNIEVSGGTVALAGTNWENTSTLAISSGTLNLEGSFTQSRLGTFSRSGGTVNLVLNQANTRLVIWKIWPPEFAQACASNFRWR